MKVVLIGLCVIAIYIIYAIIFQLMMEHIWKEANHTLFGILAIFVFSIGWTYMGLLLLYIIGVYLL